MAIADEHLVDILEPPRYLPNGETQGIVDAIRSASWLHTTDVWVYRTQPELQILFQQRPPDSPTYPGVLDCSVAGYLEAGETGVQGGVRETLEELGLKVKESDLVPFGRRLNAMLDHRGRERKIVANTNLLKWDGELGDLKLSPSEVYAVFWISTTDVLCIEKGKSAIVYGLNPRGEKLERNVSISDFAYNLDSYHFRIAERIERLESRK